LHFFKDNEKCCRKGFELIVTYERNAYVDIQYIFLNLKKVISLATINP